jgi:hypothetical protein
VFLLPRHDLVVRIARTGALLPRVTKVARLAAWFEQVGAPTIRLAVHYPGQPVSAGHSLATIWDYLPPTQAALTTEDLGIHIGSSGVSVAAATPGGARVRPPHR